MAEGRISPASLLSHPFCLWMPCCPGSSPHHCLHRPPEELPPVLDRSPSDLIRCKGNDQQSWVHGLSAMPCKSSTTCAVLLGAGCASQEDWREGNCAGAHASLQASTSPPRPAKVSAHAMLALVEVVTLNPEGLEDVITFRRCAGGCLGRLALLDGLLGCGARLGKGLRLQAVHKCGAGYARLCQHTSPGCCCMPPVFCSSTDRASGKLSLSPATPSRLVIPTRAMWACPCQQVPPWRCGGQTLWVTFSRRQLKQFPPSRRCLGKLNRTSNNCQKMSANLERRAGGWHRTGGFSSAHSWKIKHIQDSTGTHQAAAVQEPG